MSTTRTRILAAALALALLATAAVAGTTTAQPSENTTESPGSFTYDGDTLLVANASGATISGETSLDTGTEVTVRIRSSSGSSAQFLKTDTATVAENGTFSATFDFHGVPGNTSIVASATSADAGVIAETEGRVVDEMPTDTTETTGTANGEGQPGFGVVAALLALCGTTLVALRGRRD